MNKVTGKGVIVQIYDSTVYVLKNDGGFASCPRDPVWQLGDVITLRARPRILSLGASIIALAVLLALLVVYQTPATYVELSVNPAVQITANRFGRVLRVDGLNADGEALIQGMKYKNLAFTEVYLRLVNRLDNGGFLDEATMQFVVANDSQLKIAAIEENLRGALDPYSRRETLQVSIKRYEKDAYLALTHPIPIASIPPESVPPGEPPVTPAPTDDSGHHGSGNMHGMGMRRGMWQDGWWDWDCGE